MVHFFSKVTTKEPSVFVCVCVCVCVCARSVTVVFNYLKDLNVVKKSSLYGCDNFFFVCLAVIFQNIKKKLKDEIIRG